MSKKILTEQIKRYILDNYQVKAAVEIQKELGLKKYTIHNYYRQLGIRSPKELSNRARNITNQGRTSSTPSTDNFIRQNYLTMPVKTMAKAIGRSDSLITKRLKQLGLIIPPDIIEQRKKDSQIKKGQVPTNKGKKMSPDLYAKAAPTMFKKGSQPPNTKQDGYTSIRIDNHGHPYAYIRISKGKFELLHRKLWMDVNGPVPEGMILTFKNKDSTDIRLENLELISRQEHLDRNKMMDYPDDLKDTIKTLTKLRKTIKDYEQKQ